jgi:hypothetical protein
MELLNGLEVGISLPKIAAIHLKDPPSYIENQKRNTLQKFHINNYTSKSYRLHGIKMEHWIRNNTLIQKPQNVWGEIQYTAPIYTYKCSKVRQHILLHGTRLISIYVLGRSTP